MAFDILKNNSFGAAQPISTDGGPPAWAVDKRAELGWPSSRGKGWPAVCNSGYQSLQNKKLPKHLQSQVTRPYPKYYRQF